jgi:hypothetical protein
MVQYTEAQINLNEDIANIMLNYYSLLLGDAELIHAFAHLKEKYKDIDLAGKIDFQTGLRYPDNYKL